MSPTVGIRGDAAAELTVGCSFNFSSPSRARLPLSEPAIARHRPVPVRARRRCIVQVGVDRAQIVERVHLFRIDLQDLGSFPHRALHVVVLIEQAAEFQPAIDVLGIGFHQPFRDRRWRRRACRVRSKAAPCEAGWADAPVSWPVPPAAPSARARGRLSNCWRTGALDELDTDAGVDSWCCSSSQSGTAIAPAMTPRGHQPVITGLH